MRLNELQAKILSPKDLQSLPLKVSDRAAELSSDFEAVDDKGRCHTGLWIFGEPCATASAFRRAGILGGIASSPAGSG
jgi:hypothetical protein